MLLPVELRSFLVRSPVGLGLNELAHDLAEAIAFALRYRGKKRVHQADEYMAQIAAERIVEHLERARFVVMRKPALVGPLRSGAASRANRSLPRAWKGPTQGRRHSGSIGLSGHLRMVS